MCYVVCVCRVGGVCGASSRQRRAPNPRGRHINLNIIKQEEKQNARGLLFLTWDPWRSRRLEFITVMIINLKEERRDSSRVYCNKKWRAALAVARRVFLRILFHILDAVACGRACFSALFLLRRRWWRRRSSSAEHYWPRRQNETIGCVCGL